MTADRGGHGTGPADRIEIIGVTPFGRPAAQLAVAVARAGGTGVLDLGPDRSSGLAALADVRRWWTGPFGVRVPPGCRVDPAEVPQAAGTVVVGTPALLDDSVAGFAAGRRLLVEVAGPAEAAAVLPVARGLTADVGLIARGCEDGGRAGEPTTFVLLQRLLAEVDVPVYAAGGIGPHSAAAAVAGGAAGIVLDEQFAAVREMDPPASADTTAGGAADAAGTLAGRHKTAGGVVRAVREQITAHLRAAVRAEPLAPRTDPAVVQGPMAHVTGGSAFAGAVAQDGGLPFLTLDLMDGERSRTLLGDVADRLGGRPWGVCVDAGAAERFAAVRAAAPPYAIVTGGGPADAASLEAAGTRAYLPVPSPEVLGRFLAEGARRFVFAGAECGGPAGPRGGLPLWDALVERLMGFDDGPVSVIFAGGVHDERSAAMVAALAGPLAEQGADIRIMMGTAYLFTMEAVATGAVTPTFQEVALDCEGTALLETGPGHVVRCARTPYAATFEETRRELEEAGTPAPEMWRRLERLNLGRLRVAAEGVGFATPVEPERQRSEGLYPMGQAAVLRSATTRLAVLHEQVTTGATAFLASRAASLGVLAAEPVAARPADIAIIGMDCVFAGAADADRYWANVVGGVEAITEVTRWDPEVHYDPSGEGKSVSKWGGFIPDVPVEVLDGVDPGRLLAREVAARALRDAGYGDRPFDRARTSVFFGAEGGGDLAAAHALRATLPSYLGEVPPELDEQLPQPTQDAIPGRIAQRVADGLGLGGVHYTVDTSLAALDAACKELADGSSDMALCGGLDLRGGIRDYLALSAAGALSPSGRCAAFDASADGTVPGEGVACVVLRRLADAERDGDRIYAVVKSVAGGAGAVERAYRRAGVAPASVDLVEADGTGDPEADRAELAALAPVFAGASPGGVVLGSVKAQIGHTGSAAGLAGLVKAARALHTGVLPGAAHVVRPAAPDGPFTFPARARPWPAAPGERFAGVGDGAGLHAVLAGYGGAPEPLSGLAEWPAELFLVRGGHAETDRLLDLLRDGPRLRDLARTAAAAEGPVRAAFVAADLDEAREKLALVADSRPAPGVFTAAGEPGDGPGAEPGQVAFLFSGRGTDLPDDLFIAFPRLQRLLRTGGRTAAGLAVHRLLTAVGVHPDLAAGHGSGELVALCAAGVLDESDLAELSAVRAEAILLAAEEAPGAMAAVTGSPREVRAVLPGISGIGIARHDAPRRVVLAGTHQGLDAALDALAAAGLAAERLPEPCALHSPLAAAASARLRAALTGRDLRSPAFPVWTNTTAAPYGTDPSDLAATLARQICVPVRFVEQIEAMYEAGARVFVDAGPGHVLAGRVGEILGDRPHTAVGVGGGHGLTALLDALARLAAAGVPVDPLPLFAGRDARLLDGAAAPASGWLVNGHLVRTRDGDYPPNALRPPKRLAGAGAEAAVLEFLRTGREMLAAQRDVVLRHLSDPVPAPRPVLQGETVPGAAPSAAAAPPARALPETADDAPPPQNGASVSTHGGDDAAGLPPQEDDPDCADSPMFVGDAPDPEDVGSGGDLEPQEEDGDLTYAEDDAGGEASGHGIPETDRPSHDVVANVQWHVAPEDVLPTAEGPADAGLMPQEGDLALAGSILTAQGAARETGASGPVGASTAQSDLPAQGGNAPHGVPSTMPSDDVAGAAVLPQPGLPAQEARPGPVEPESPAGAEPAVRGGRVERRVPRLTELDALPMPPMFGTVFTGRRFLVVDDGCGVAGELCGLLERHGAQAWTSMNVDGPCDGLVHLGALRPAARNVLPQGLTEITRALDGGLRWLVLAGGAGGTFGRWFGGGVIGDPGPGAGLRGLARTVALERPEVLVRALDVDTRDTPRAIAQRILAELLCPDAPVVIGHADGLRHGLTTVPAEPHAAGSAGTVGVGPDGVVLLTGGAQGVTARVALELARTCGCHIEVTGPPLGEPSFPDVPDEAGLRRALTASASGDEDPAEIEATIRGILTEREIRRNLEALEEHAASVRYHAGDVRAVVEDVYRRHARLDGVIHGAGLTATETDAYRAKADTAHTLVQAVSPDIGFFVVLAGLAGVHGERGRIAHAVADDACDTLAHVWRTRLRGRVLVADCAPSMDDAGAAALLREIAAGDEPHVVFAEAGR